MEEKVCGDWYSRCGQERTELLDKLGKLETFIGSEQFNKLDQLDKDDLKTQCHAMWIYLTSLEHRIDREFDRRKAANK